MEREHDMERVNRILAHPFYRECVQRISEWEKTRRFCGHDMVHFLDVARIAEILNLEENREPIARDIVYGAALLHDIGRYVQYEDGTDHALASAELAPAILRECGYDRDEEVQILEAVACHRRREVQKGSDLKGILYRADKASRPCYACLMREECDWDRRQKNGKIKI